MDDAARQFDLVTRALKSGLSNCVEWIDDKARLRVRNDVAVQGLTPEYIKRILIDFVRQGGALEQFSEQRERWKGRRDYWYRAIIPHEGFHHGLFVELELTDDDPDVPMVSLLNAHPATP